VTQQFVQVIVLSVSWHSWNSNFPVQHPQVLRNAESGASQKSEGEKYGSENTIPLYE
jgi:hypothetical protein